MTKLEAIVELTKSAMANGVIVAAHNSVHTTIEQANAKTKKQFVILSSLFQRLPKI